MKFLRLAVNWLAILTAPLWSLPVFIVMLVKELQEYKRRESEGDSNFRNGAVENFIRGEKWFWR
jgi:hypothetical protein